MREGVLLLLAGTALGLAGGMLLAIVYGHLDMAFWLAVISIVCSHLGFLLDL